MKRNKPMIALLSAVAFTMGCNKEETTTQQINKVQAKTAEVSQDLKDYTYAQKAEFIEAMQKQLNEIKNDLNDLGAKIEKSGDPPKAEAQRKLQALREKADQLGKQVDEAKNATESNWQSVKAGSRKAYDELKDGFNQARQWVSDKIAP